MAQSLSPAGRALLLRWEGVVKTAYVDPANVVTIGAGFTNLSGAFKRWARSRWGRPMRRGDRMTIAEIETVVDLIVKEEFGAAVVRYIAPTEQHHFDGATLAAYNLGPGSVRWDWGRALAARRIVEAGAALLKYVKGGGRPLPGLIKRRKRERRVIVYADYGSDAFPRFDGTPSLRVNEVLKEYQGKLKRVGFDPGPIDGLGGPRTRAAVLAFQTDHPDLENDGILGRATMAQIDRALDARTKAAPGAGGAVVAGGGTATQTEQIAADAPRWVDMAIYAGIAAIVVVVLAALAWRYRVEIQHSGRRIGRALAEFWRGI